MPLLPLELEDTRFVTETPQRRPSDTVPQPQDHDLRPGRGLTTDLIVASMLGGRGSGCGRWSEGRGKLESRLSVSCLNRRGSPANRLSRLSPGAYLAVQRRALWVLFDIGLYTQADAGAREETGALSTVRVKAVRPLVSERTRATASLACLVSRQLVQGRQRLSPAVHPSASLQIKLTVIHAIFSECARRTALSPLAPQKV